MLDMCKISDHHHHHHPLKSRFPLPFLLDRYNCVKVKHYSRIEEKKKEASMSLFPWVIKIVKETVEEEMNKK